MDFDDEGYLINPDALKTLIGLKAVQKGDQVLVDLDAWKRGCPWATTKSSYSGVLKGTVTNTRGKELTGRFRSPLAVNLANGMGRWSFGAFIVGWKRGMDH